MSRTARAASALKSSVVLGGSAILSAVNGVTPHMSGAVDVMVVRQPDGSFKSSPFYVRFSKYSALRYKDKSVKVYVNGELAGFEMVVGPYGQAYIEAPPDDESAGSEKEEVSSSSSGSVEGTSSSGSPLSRADDGPAPPGAQPATSRRDSMNGGDGGGCSGDGGGTPTMAAARRLSRGSELRIGDASPFLGASADADGSPESPTLGGHARRRFADDAGDVDSTRHSTPQTTPSSHHGRSVSLQISSFEPLHVSLEVRDGDSHHSPRGGLHHTHHRRHRHHRASLDASGQRGKHIRSSASVGHLPPVSPLTAQVQDAWLAGTQPDPSDTEPRMGSSPDEASSLGAMATCTAYAATTADGTVATAFDSPAGEQPASGASCHTHVGFPESLGEVAAQQAMDAAAAAAAAGALETSDVSGEVAHVTTTDGPLEPPQWQQAAQLMAEAQPRGLDAAELALGDELAAGAAATSIIPGPVSLLSSQLQASDRGLLARSSEDARAAAASPRALMQQQQEQQQQQALGAISAEAGAALGSAAAAGDSLQLLGSSPVDSTPLLGSSPTSLGYLGDSEAGGRGLGSLHGSAATLSPLHGFQMSLCGALLRKDMIPEEARQVFEAHRVSAETFERQGADIARSPNLIVRLGGELYPWSVAMPAVMGALAFGGSWQQRLAAQGPGLAAGKADEEPPRKSWRLWLFGGKKAAAAAEAGKPAPPLSPTAAAAETRPTLFRGRRAVSAGGALNLATETTAVESTAAVGAAVIATATVTAAVPAPSAVKKTLNPTSDQLASLQLKEGQNTVVFRTGSSEVRCYMYLLRWDSRLVVSDIDGTITRSDLLGHVLPAIGVDWSHAGISQLFTNIESNGYQLMYLSSRSIGQANITREYLHRLVQPGGHRMPSGPVIISPHGLLPSLYREMILRRPHEFKIACLQDIRALFPTDCNPFYAGLGNRDTDVISYKEAGVPLGRIFVINPRGEIRRASCALRSSTWASLAAINGLVHEVFPPIREDPASKIADQQRDEFNDLQFWRTAPNLGLALLESEGEDRQWPNGQANGHASDEGDSDASDIEYGGNTIYAHYTL